MSHEIEATKMNHKCYDCDWLRFDTLENVPYCSMTFDGNDLINGKGVCPVETEKGKKLLEQMKNDGIYNFF
jgi:hypothetical protein